MERLGEFFSDNFMMPHGFCFLWKPEIVWLHVIADALIALAYFSIPLALWYFARKRPDMPFHKLMLMFAAFICLCGLTHIVNILVLWKPYYGIEGLIKLMTGIVSAMTAYAVWQLMPKALTLPSPEQLEKMNADLAATNREIEQKVKERTEALEKANAELHEARRKAERANAAKSDFLANISHEIRTPMNAVVVLSQKLAESQLENSLQRECAETLAQSANSLMSLLNDVLDFSKIEANVVELESVPFRLDELVQESIRIFSVKAEEKGLKLYGEVEPHPFPRLMGDPGRIRQILLNLINNSLKFTETGEVALKVNAASAGPDTWDVSIVVRDTGVGIPSDKISNLFQKFTQADSTISRKYGGTGLGLAISHELVERMNGHITVTSEPGKGSVFTIALTLKEATPFTTEPLKVMPVQRVSSHTQPLMLVEDTPANILVASVLLDTRGYSYKVAKSGKEALALYQPGAFSLILMDLRLPDMTGYEITESIRALEKENGSKHVPIIALTAYATSEERQKCETAGMDDFLTKPVDQNTLFELLEKYIEA